MRDERGAAEAAIEGVQASVDALKLLSGGWSLKIEILLVSNCNIKLFILLKRSNVNARMIFLKSCCRVSNPRLEASHLIANGYKAHHRIDVL